jgi:hypothetical protein
MRGEIVRDSIASAELRVAPALQFVGAGGNDMSHLETIEISMLGTVCGGQQVPDEPPRSWGQVAREYGAACVQGAGQSLVYGGRPRSAREGLRNAALGCAMGVGMKAVDDVSMALGGGR